MVLSDRSVMSSLSICYSKGTNEEDNDILVTSSGNWYFIW